MLADFLPGGLGAFALIIAAIVLVLVLLLVWLLSRDRDVTRTSFGFYVERRRFDDPPSSWPEPPLPPPASEQTQPMWPAVPKEQP